jgi:SHS2 domain-containing protein
MSVGFELVEHTADIGVHAWGRTAPEVFEEAARGMFSLICDPGQIGHEQSLDIELEAPQQDMLLVAWLNELLYLFEARHVLFADFEVLQADATRLRAVATGEALQPGRQAVCGGVKAATYHQLSLTSTEQGWEAQVFLDV